MKRQQLLFFMIVFAALAVLPASAQWGGVRLRTQHSSLYVGPDGMWGDVCLNGGRGPSIQFNFPRPGYGWGPPPGWGYGPAPSWGPSPYDNFGGGYNSFPPANYGGYGEQYNPSPSFPGPYLPPEYEVTVFNPRDQDMRVELTDPGGGSVRESRYISRGSSTTFRGLRGNYAARVYGYAQNNKFYLGQWPGLISGPTTIRL